MSLNLLVNPRSPAKQLVEERTQNQKKASEAEEKFAWASENE